jgi:hypothetical protein
MSHDLFFTPEFSSEFEWKNFHLRVGSVLPHNKKQISDGLRDMSPETIRYRFLGSKRDFSERELQYLTVLDGWNHYAIGIEEREKLKRGVGIVRMVRASHSETEAEIAITIIDEYQKMGLGMFFLDLIVLAALERKIETLSFTFLPQNEAILKLINRTGTPIAGPANQDYVQLFLDLNALNVEEIKTRLAKTLPSIGTFHLKT